MPQLLPGGVEYLQIFVTSLAVGLLIGLERERNPAAKAGLRTFALVALFGTLCAMLAAKAGMPWLLAVGLLTVGLFIVAAYLRCPPGEADPGTTTEAALLVCYTLGALIWYGLDTLAITLGIATTVLLYFKPELHGISQRLERRDLISIFQFAVLTFVILPILPDRGYGPHQAVNPYNVWLMVVLLSGISLSGYVALRLVGPRQGAPVLGIVGGVVSSTATTLVYARHGKMSDDLGHLAALIILLANLVTVVRLAVIGAVVAPSILPALLPVLGGALALGLATTPYWWRKLGQKGELPPPPIKNPAEIRVSLTFGLLYATILFLSAWLSDYAGQRGLYALAMVSGLTDLDAITLSSLRLFSLGRLLPGEAVTTIVIALVANLVFKFGIVWVIGGTRLAKRVLPGMAAVAVGAGGALLL
jgi:uncharacterized membrane protein (DUF4010 family)